MHWITSFWTIYSIYKWNDVRKAFPFAPPVPPLNGLGESKILSTVVSDAFSKNRFGWITPDRDYPKYWSLVRKTCSCRSVHYMFITSHYRSCDKSMRHVGKKRREKYSSEISGTNPPIVEESLQMSCQVYSYESIRMLVQKKSIRKWIEMVLLKIYSWGI